MSNRRTDSHADAVLRGFYDRALVQSPRLFRANIVGHVKQYVPFDIGFWATGDLYRGMMTLTEWGWDGYPSFAAAAQTPHFLSLLADQHGSRVDSLDSDPDFEMTPFFQSDLAPRNIRHVIGLSQIDRQGQLRDIVLLARRASSRPFSAQEQERASRLGPYLFHAAGLNLHSTLMRHMDSSFDAAYCVCDADGHIYSYSETLEEMLTTRLGQMPPSLPLDFTQRTKSQMFRDLLVTINALDYARAATDMFFIVSVRPSNGLEHLTQREMQLASAVCANHTYKRIAHDLGLSPSTVGNVMSRVYKKLGIQGRADLMTLMGAISREAPDGA